MRVETRLRQVLIAVPVVLAVTLLAACARDMAMWGASSKQPASEVAKIDLRDGEPRPFVERVARGDDVLVPPYEKDEYGEAKPFAGYMYLPPGEYTLFVRPLHAQKIDQTVEINKVSTYSLEYEEARVHELAVALEAGYVYRIVIEGTGAQESVRLEVVSKPSSGGVFRH